MRVEKKTKHPIRDYNYLQCTRFLTKGSKSENMIISFSHSLLDIEVSNNFDTPGEKIVKFGV